MISVVIPVFNKVHLTERCLQSILDHSSFVSQVFVVDNASSDETQPVLTSFKTKFEEKGFSFQIITNQKNVGFGRACNQGVRASKGEYVAIVNNDTWLMPEWDRGLKKAIEERGLDLVGPFFDERPFSADPVSTAKTFLEKNGNRFRKHFVPILLFFKRSAIEKLKFEHGGIFDERYFVTYEDTDLLRRMRDLKMTYGQTSLCYIWHQSMGTRSSLPSGYEQEGLKLFMEKWGYDPRPEEHTLIERWKRKYRKSRASRGMF